MNTYKEDQINITVNRILANKEITDNELRKLITECVDSCISYYDRHEDMEEPIRYIGEKE